MKKGSHKIKDFVGKRRESGVRAFCVAKSRRRVNSFDPRK